MRQPGKVQMQMKVTNLNPVAAVHGDGSTVRVALMRAAEKLGGMYGAQFRKGSTHRLQIDVTRTR